MDTIKKIDWQKWAAIATVVGVLIAALAYVTSTLGNNEPQIFIAPLPTGIPPTPSPTPKPTVIGTPVTSYHGLAVTGGQNFVTMANNISLIVDEVQAFPTGSDGTPELSGYSRVVVKLRITNENINTSISSYDITLVDDFSNQYVDWGILGFQELPTMPSVLPGESAAGALVYRVPNAALSNKLRVRLEKEDIVTRIEIMLGTISLTSP